MTAVFTEQRGFTVADLVSQRPELGSARTWRRRIAAREIGVLRVDGSIVIPETELERFLAERFIPAREVRRIPAAEDVAEIIDAATARHRGRPRIVR